MRPSARARPTKEHGSASFSPRSKAGCSMGLKASMWAIGSRCNLSARMSRRGISISRRFNNRSCSPLCISAIFYNFSGRTVTVPPLRERMEDIALLFDLPAENWVSAGHKRAKFTYCSLPHIITPSIRIPSRRIPHITSGIQKVMVIYDHWSYVTMILRSALSPLAVAFVKVLIYKSIC